MSEVLSKWFKDNCKDVGHLYYGKIMQIIKRHETEENMDYERRMSDLADDKE